MTDAWLVGCRERDDKIRIEKKYKIEKPPNTRPALSKLAPAT